MSANKNQFLKDEMTKLKALSKTSVNFHEYKIYKLVIFLQEGLDNSISHDGNDTYHFTKPFHFKELCTKGEGCILPNQFETTLCKKYRKAGYACDLHVNFDNESPKGKILLTKLQ